MISKRFNKLINLVARDLPVSEIKHIVVAPRMRGSIYVGSAMGLGA